jgi:hypothetical protein
MIHHQLNLALTNQRSMNSIVMPQLGRRRSADQTQRRPRLVLPHEESYVLKRLIEIHEDPIFHLIPYVTRDRRLLRQRPAHPPRLLVY